MDELIKWVMDNKEWLFSGIGIVVLVWIVRTIFKRRETNSAQSIQTGKDSINFQAGRDVNLNNRPKSKDVG